MRLTGGLDRGRKLRAPHGQGRRATTRPTGAKVRQAIFNILGPPPKEPVLDLFAGTGALGIEALSRGAPAASFVEREARALAALSRNLRDLGLESRATVIGLTVLDALRRLEERADRFGWVFVDPPYASDSAADVLSVLSDGNVLASGGVVIVEHDKRHVPPDSLGSLRMTDRRYYGDTGVSFYRRYTGLA